MRKINDQRVLDNFEQNNFNQFLLKKRRTVICERCCADFFFDVVHCLFCAFCKGNLLNSLRCLAQS